MWSVGIGVTIHFGVGTRLPDGENGYRGRNWDLSTDRALAVLKAMVDMGMDPSRLSALGNAQYNPIVPNTDDASRAQGLMHRTHLASDAGMLFDFKTPLMAAFWMKDTPLPLDMLFVRADGTISTVAANAVPNSTAEIISGRLRVNQIYDAADAELRERTKAWIDFAQRLAADAEASL